MERRTKRSFMTRYGSSHYRGGLCRHLMCLSPGWKYLEYKVTPQSHIIHSTSFIFLLHSLPHWPLWMQSTPVVLPRGIVHHKGYPRLPTLPRSTPFSVYFVFMFLGPCSFSNLTSFLSSSEYLPIITNSISLHTLREWPSLSQM